MRPDTPKQHAQQKEGARDEARDLEQQRQPRAAANRDLDKRGDDETGQGKVRSQDPNFGRGHH